MTVRLEYYITGLQVRYITDIEICRQTMLTSDIVCCIFTCRPHRMHEMRPIAIDDPGRLSVCLSRGFAVQTRLNGSTSFLWRGLLGTQGALCLTGVPIYPTDSMRLSPNYFGQLFTPTRHVLRSNIDRDLLNCFHSHAWQMHYRLQLAKQAVVPDLTN